MSNLVEGAAAAPARAPRAARAADVAAQPSIPVADEWDLPGSSPLPSPGALRRKRLFDVVVGSVLALLALPLIVVLAAITACTLRANPFFVQRRPGSGSSQFRMVKLRTLPKSFPVQAVKPEIAGVRLPRFAGWMRRTHLDELPQLLEVVVGRMSLVGPRPRLADEVEPVEPHYDRLRRCVPPGCSGLWQISVAGVGQATSGPSYDLFYLCHASLRLDLWVLFRTLTLSLGLTDRIELIDVPAWVRAGSSTRPDRLVPYPMDVNVVEDVA
jgi:lipopolysaccharide/colanic/teichoic acid biosynthesis glycosyltransferase